MKKKLWQKSVHKHNNIVKSKLKFFYNKVLRQCLNNFMWNNTNE